MSWIDIYNEEFRKLPEYFQHKSFSYKHWMAIDLTLPHDFKNILASECSRINRIFCIFYDRIYNPSIFDFLCMKKIYSKDEVLSFANLNNECLTKICDRLDMKQWLYDCKSSIQYEFLGGMRLKAMTLTKPIECPICLDNFDKDIIISRCGHHCCFGCVRKICNIKTQHGILYHLIQNNSNIKCHTCRKRNPYYEFIII